MKIQKLSISGIGGLKELTLSFNQGFNVICGANGIGKTTILNIVADAFVSSNSQLKRNSQYKKGAYCIEFIDHNGVSSNRNLEVKEFNPLAHDTGRYASDNTPYVLLFNINRIINYQPIDSVPKDPRRNIYDVGNILADGVEIHDLKGWFINRYLFCDKTDSLTEEQAQNFLSAQSSFSILDDKVYFKSIDPGSLDIRLSTNAGDIYFEYLSAGYKTCVYIVLGIIKEIEFRFRDPYLKVADFDGVILIDEIDLHLHPTWQARLINTLKKLFPKAQFIVTTHSPSILQSLRTEEIIPLTMDAERNVSIKELELGEYGLQGWTLEEILRDVMEMPETTSEIYQETLRKYDQALNNDDELGAKEAYAILQKMLHPNSNLRKLLEIQMAGLED